MKGFGVFFSVCGHGVVVYGDFVYFTMVRSVILEEI